MQKLLLKIIVISCLLDQRRGILNTNNVEQLYGLNGPPVSLFSPCPEMLWAGRKNSTACPLAPKQELSERTYTMADVSQHFDMTSCWIVIDDGVYDVTEFLSKVCVI